MKIKIGFIPTHRSGLDIDWARKMRERSIAKIKSNKNIELIYPEDGLVKDGIITGYADSVKTIELFRRENISGIIIGTMSFGEEVPVLNICEKFSNLPFLVYGTKEGPLKPDGHFTSYSMCGTLGITSGLYKRGIKFKFTDLCFPEEEVFLDDISDFIRTCNVLKSFNGARIGVVGTRPRNFETVAVNESVMIQKYQQKVIPMSLLDLYRLMNLYSDAVNIRNITDEIRSGYNCSLIDDSALERIARLEAVLQEFIRNEDLACIAIQCWSAIQEQIKISPCLTLGRLTGLGIPAACEADVFGALTMLVQYANSLNKGIPHIMDIVTNDNRRKDVFLTYHCGNASKNLAKEGTDVIVREHGIFGGLWGKENCLGTAEFQLKQGDIIINRLIENNAEYKLLITDGEVVESDDKLRGSWGWVKVRDLKKLYRTIAEEGFIHHYCMTYDCNVKSLLDFCEFAGIKKVVV
ncbi:MAG: hypothetical protein FJW66_01755 [Actinobacteria bacterium]|nr:hypothetical protein [Actinomycetota bacterium]